jgi:hypothetical protein
MITGARQYESYCAREGKIAAQFLMQWHRRRCKKLQFMRFWGQVGRIHAGVDLVIQSIAHVNPGSWSSPA